MEIKRNGILVITLAFGSFAVLADAQTAPASPARAVEQESQVEATSFLRSGSLWRSILTLRPPALPLLRNG